MWRKIPLTELAKLKEGFLYGNSRDSKVLNFIDNHDKQRDEPENFITYKGGIKYSMAVAYMLAWDYGYPRVMSSYAFDVKTQGPPNTGASTSYETKSPTFDADEKCSAASGWVSFKI